MRRIAAVSRPQVELLAHGDRPPDRLQALRQGRALEWLTLGCCLLETGIGLICGTVHNSVALLSFGGESCIEVASASVVIWRLSHDHLDQHDVERRCLRGEGYCFIALGLFVTFESISALWKRETPSASVLGVALSLFSLLVMPVLATAKKRVGSALSSDALKADATQSALCGYFALILLIGLLLNQHFGLWWADSAASLTMVPVIVAEAKRSLEGRSCSHCH